MYKQVCALHAHYTQIKDVREIDQKEHHKSFCNGDEVHGSVTLSGPVVRPVAYVSLPGLSAGDFNISLGAIMKNTTLGNGVLHNFLYQGFTTAIPRGLVNILHYSVSG